MADQTLDNRVEEEERGGHEKQEEQDEASGGQEVESPLAKLLLSELECPICLEYMVGRDNRPLLCKNGHACCSFCRRRLGSRCPTCRSWTNWGRCLALEKLGEHLVEKGHMHEEQGEEVVGFVLEEVAQMDGRSGGRRGSRRRTRRGGSSGEQQ